MAVTEDIVSRLTGAMTMQREPTAQRLCFDAAEEIERLRNLLAQIAAERAAETEMLSDEKIVALAARNYKSAASAVAAHHGAELMIKDRLIEHWQRKAKSAETELERIIAARKSSLSNWSA